MHRDQLLSYLENVLQLEIAIETYQKAQKGIDEKRALLGWSANIVEPQMPKSNKRSFGAPLVIKLSQSIGEGVFDRYSTVSAVLAGLLFLVAEVAFLYGLYWLFFIVPFHRQGKQHLSFFCIHGMDSPAFLHH